MKWLFVVFLISYSLSFEAHAACASPAGVAGQISWISASSAVKFCDGTNWIDTTVSTKTSCSGTTAGTMNYSSGDFLFCNGTNWISMKGASGSSCSGTTAGSFKYNTSSNTYQFCNGTNWYDMVNSISGYFVLTAGQWNGNLGGLSGADSKCLSDLTTYDWAGKANATLDSTHVHAFLCDGTTCRNLQANTKYKFAVSNNTSLGGGSFTTNASGQGPNDNADWSATTAFGAGDKFYWTARDFGTITAWVTAASETNHCSVWTSTATSGKGRRGYNVDTNQARWYNTNSGCNSLLNLVCVVDP